VSSLEQRSQFLNESGHVWYVSLTLVKTLKSLKVYLLYLRSYVVDLAFDHFVQLKYSQHYLLMGNFYKHTLYIECYKQSNKPKNSLYGSLFILNYLLCEEKAIEIEITPLHSIHIHSLIHSLSLLKKAES
jgi:hypothetical protein